MDEAQQSPGWASSEGADALGACATRLLCHSRPLHQDVFLEVLMQNAGADPAELFSFRTPRHATTRQRKNASSVLVLDAKQHSVMYALAGCVDVMHVMSKVKPQVRKALHSLYNIDKASFYLWFKNRATIGRKGKATPEPPPAALPAPNAQDIMLAKPCVPPFWLLPEVTKFGISLVSFPLWPCTDLPVSLLPPAASVTLGPIVPLHGVAVPPALQQPKVQGQTQTAAGQCLSLAAAVQQYHQLSSTGGISGIERLLGLAQCNQYKPGSGSQGSSGSNWSSINNGSTLATLV